LISALVDAFFQLARDAVVVRAGSTNRKIYDTMMTMSSRVGVLEPPWYRKFEKCALRLAKAIGETAPKELYMIQSDEPNTRFDSLIMTIIPVISTRYAALSAEERHRLMI
jgi:hypothetical protein